MSIPLLEVQFDKEAQRLIPAQEEAVARALSAPGNTVAHVVVIGHGWNNDMDEARTLYREFLGHLEVVVGAAAPTILAIGVLWPSKRFADAELIPGGAASAGADPNADRALADRLQELKSLFGDAEADAKLDQMKALVPGLHADPSKQKKFVSLLGEIADRHLEDAQRTVDEGQAKISGQNGADLLKAFSAPILGKVAPGGGGAAGGGLGGNPAVAPGGSGAAAGIGDFLTGIGAGAMRLLNLVTYQTMKDRAGIIGRDGVNPFLSRVQASAAPAVAFHLVGHSFGGRLVTAAIDGPNRLRVQSLLLLQAAYSHNGLARNFDGHGGNGFFHAVLDGRKVTGPILITHSKHDSAVGLAYPLASRLNGANASRFGDKNDPFGGMGANGAQHVDDERAEIALLPAGGVYDFTSGGKRIFNLNGDDSISSHGDVARAETAYALAKAMGL
jgi:hypothetical protein